MSTRVHPTAIVHPRAELDEGVSVGPYCVIGEKVEIAAGTVLHNHVTVQGPAAIGRDNVVYPYAVLGAEPQDLKYQGMDTRLVIGHRNRIREQVTIHRGTELGGGVTSIGNDCLIMVGVHIAHDCIIEDQVIMANGTMLGGHCLIEFGAGIGGGAGIHHFATVGTLSFVGGMARVSRDVPPYVVVEGSPAEPRKVNSTAFARRAWDQARADRVKAAFKALFRSPDVPALLAIDRLRRQMPDAPEVIRLCDFVERMQLGVHGRHRELLRGQGSVGPRSGEIAPRPA